VDDPLTMYLSDIFTLSANLAGIPGMSVPCGFSEEGLPIGLQIMGKYFGEGKGITLFTFSSDQFTEFYGIIIPGAVREALYILDGLLEQQTELRPVEIMSDTAGYTDIVFGLFWLLGYQFSPRLRDIGKTRFWRVNRKARYGALNNVARHKINTKRIVENWDDGVESK